MHAEALNPRLLRFGIALRGGRRRDSNQSSREQCGRRGGAAFMRISTFPFTLPSGYALPQDWRKLLHFSKKKLKVLDEKIKKLKSIFCP